MSLFWTGNGNDPPDETEYLNVPSEGLHHPAYAGRDYPKTGRLVDTLRAITDFIEVHDEGECECVKEETG